MEHNPTVLLSIILDKSLFSFIGDNITPKICQQFYSNFNTPLRPVYHILQDLYYFDQL